MQKSAKIYIAGHRGLVGSALVRCLESQGYTNLITRTRQELDLTRQSDVEAFFQSAKPDYVFLAAAKVGGIWANDTYPAEFSYSNVCIQTNVVHSAWQNGVKRMLFLGSSCIYPRECPQPMREEHLLTAIARTGDNNSTRQLLNSEHAGNPMPHAPFPEPLETDQDLPGTV